MFFLKNERLCMKDIFPSPQNRSLFRKSDLVTLSARIHMIKRKLQVQADPEILFCILVGKPLNGLFMGAEDAEKQRQEWWSKLLGPGHNTKEETPEKAFKILSAQSSAWLERNLINSWNNGPGSVPLEFISLESIQDHRAQKKKKTPKNHPVPASEPLAAEPPESGKASRIALNPISAPPITGAKNEEKDADDFATLSISIAISKKVREIIGQYAKAQKIQESDITYAKALQAVGEAIGASSADMDSFLSFRSKEKITDKELNFLSDPDQGALCFCSKFNEFFKCDQSPVRIWLKLVWGAKDTRYAALPKQPEKIALPFARKTAPSEIMSQDLLDKIRLMQRQRGAA